MLIMFLMLCLVNYLDLDLNILKKLDDKFHLENLIYNKISLFFKKNKFIKFLK